MKYSIKFKGSTTLSRIAACMASFLFVAGCGGGGGGSGGSRASTEGNTSRAQTAGGVENGAVTSAPQVQSLSGTVAIGKPLQGARITVLSANGLTKDTETDANGRYSVDVTNLPAPYLITARTSEWVTYPFLESVAIGPGTANVTPLTDLLVAQLYPNKQRFYVNSQEFMSQGPLTVQHIAAARTKVVDYLMARPSKTVPNQIAPVDATGISDFISTRFDPKPGDAYDDVLEAFKASLFTHENQWGVKEHMLNKNVKTADVDQLPVTGNGSFIKCDGNLCGQSDESTYGVNSPYYPKYSLVKALLSQYSSRSSSVELDCGPAPQVPGIQPGMNRLTIDGAVIRMNGALPNGLVYPLLSARDMNVSIKAFESNSTRKYIDRFYASIGQLSEDDDIVVSMHFKKNAGIDSVFFAHVNRGVVITSVDCFGPRDTVEWINP